MHKVLLAEQQPSAGRVHSLCHSEVSRFGTIVPDLDRALKSFFQIIQTPVNCSASLYPFSVVAACFDP